MLSRPKDTETKEMLRRYEFIINTSRDWHTLINRNYVYEAANKAFCQAHDKTPAEVVGKALADLWGRKVFEEIIKSSLDRCFGGNEVNYQAWFEVAALGLQCYDVTCYPYRGNDADVTHAVVVTRNITRQKKTDEVKRKLEAELEQARKIEALATLSGGIAHEFNNALMVVAGNIELLQLSFGDNRQVVKHNQAINESVQRMINLTQQLLAYARGGDFWMRAIDLSDLVSSTLPRIQNAIDSRIRIETRLKADLPLIQADENQFRKVLEIVMENAAEAIEGSGHIRLTTGCEELDGRAIDDYPGLEPGHYVTLTITDNGRGMQATTLKRIFEPFFSTKFQGRGLGMAAVYGIVKNHRGFIYAESNPGQGTTVRMLFPTKQAQPGGSDLPVSVSPAPAKTILVIEDEAKVLTTIAEKFKETLDR